MYEVVRGFFCAKQCLPHPGVQSFECLTYIDESYLCKHVYIGFRRTVSGDNFASSEKTRNVFLGGTRGDRQREAFENACFLNKQWCHASAPILARCPKVVVF